MTEHEKMASDFIAAFERPNKERLAKICAPDIVSFITNASGGVDKVAGRDAFLQRVFSLPIGQVKPSVRITQSHVVSDTQVMIMVEVKASKKEKSLHNFAAFLLNFRNNTICELHMVEALSAYSDAFWKEV